MLGAPVCGDGGKGSSQLRVYGCGCRTRSDDLLLSGKHLHRPWPVRMRLLCDGAEGAKLD